MKENKVIEFYMLANKLKEKLRRGWIEVEVHKERIESVAEHIYGTLILTIGLESEYELDIDINRVIKMLILHELEEVIIPDYTTNSTITREQKLIQGKTAVHEITNGLIAQSEIEKLLNEFNAHETKESLFAFHIDKLECDFQSKKYDLDGFMSFEALKNDVKNNPDADKIIADAKRPSDIWLESDRPKYKDRMFLELLDAIKNYDENKKREED